LASRAWVLDGSDCWRTIGDWRIIGDRDLATLVIAIERHSIRVAQ
jgi:hypothetical protein